MNVFFNITKQLLPSGAFWRVIPNTFKERFFLSKAQEKQSAYDLLIARKEALLPDRAAFDTEQIEAWEKALLITPATGATTEQRRAAIRQRIAHPDGVLGRQGAAYINGALSTAGFQGLELKDTDNAFADTPKDASAIINQFQAADGQAGSAQAGAYWRDVVVISTSNERDTNYYPGENMSAVALLSLPDGGAANIDEADRERLRLLLITLKPITVFIYINANYN